MSGISPGEGNGYPLQYSCPVNSVGKGAWQSELDMTEWLWLTKHTHGPSFLFDNLKFILKSVNLFLFVCSSVLFFPFFWLCCMAHGVLDPQSEIKPTSPPPVLGAWNLNHWTTKKVLICIIFKIPYINVPYNICLWLLHLIWEFLCQFVDANGIISLF